MKKTLRTVILLAISLTLVLALTACGEKKASQEQRDAITAKSNECTALLNELVESHGTIVFENESIGSTALNTVIEAGTKTLTSLKASINEWQTEIDKNLAKYTPESADKAIVAFDAILKALNLQKEAFDVALAEIEALYTEIDGN